jgi:hypothetical protein
LPSRHPCRGLFATVQPWRDSMQSAAFKQRTFLTVSFPGVPSLPIAAQTSRSTAAVSAKPETVERIYRIRYGFEDEWFQIFRKIPACHPRAAEAAWLCARSHVSGRQAGTRAKNHARTVAPSSLGRCLTAPRMSKPLQLTVIADKADEWCRSDTAQWTGPQMPPNQEI